MSAPSKLQFLAVGFDLLDENGVLAWIEGAAVSEKFTYLVTPNVDHVVMLAPERASGSGTSRTEPWRDAYRAAVAAAGLCVNDSRILARLARLSGKRLPVTPGSDIVRELVRRRRSSTGKLALVGGKPEDAAWLRQALPFHAITQYDPPMGVRDDPAAQEQIARFVENAAADIVLLAIGAPQSELVCHALTQASRARGVGLCIGASVEFLSGAKSRAPRWMQHAGLEWFFRLASEPRRLWRRYLLRGPRVFSVWWNSERRR